MNFVMDGKVIFGLGFCFICPKSPRGGWGEMFDVEVFFKIDSFEIHYFK